MSSPSVIATVGVNDHASTRLRAIADLLHKLARDFDHAGRGNGLARNFDAANRAAERHLTLLHRIKDAFKGVAIGAASYAAYKFPHMAVDAIDDFRPVEKEMLAMKVAKHISDADFETMWKQHADLARRFGVKPEETVHAQSAFALRDYSPQISMAMAENAAKLAKALGTTGDKAAMMLEGALFGTGQHIGSVEDAKRVSQRFGDIMTIMAKRGAMNAEDIEGFYKYAAAATTTARISPEQSAAIAMILKRENIRGDDSGNMLKQLAAHMLRPTNEGHVALQAAGIRYNEYLSEASRLKALNLNIALEENLGKKLSETAVARIQQAIDAGRIADRRALAAAAVDAWNEEGPKNAKGKISAQDLKQIAKQAQRVFDSSQGSLDGERLLSDMLGKLSGQQAMAFFGAKQGSKLASVIMQLQTELRNQDYLRNSKGEMDRVATERMTGVDAAASRYEATMEATRNDFVRANAGAIERIANIGQAAADYAGALSDQAKQIATMGATALSAVGNLANLGVSALILKRLMSTAPGAAGEAVAGAVTGAAATSSGAAAPSAWRAAQGGAAGVAGGAIKGGVAGAGLGLAWEFRDDIIAKLSGLDKQRMRDYVDMIEASFRRTPKTSFKDAFAHFRQPAAPSAAPAFSGAAPSAPQHVDVGVSGTVQGEATLMNKIIVEPSPLLHAIVKEAQQVKVNLQGALGRSMPANSGVVPRAAPPRSLGLGAGGFGFGVAGTK